MPDSVLNARSLFLPSRISIAYCQRNLYCKVNATTNTYGIASPASLHSWPYIFTRSESSKRIYNEPSPERIEVSVRVLVVEDEVLVAMELRGLLEKYGYEVADTVTTGADALEAARNEPLDLVLMDVRLDGPLDGIETAERLRAEQDLPIIFLTAFSGEATLSRAKAADCTPRGRIKKKGPAGAKLRAEPFRGQYEW